MWLNNDIIFCPFLYSFTNNSKNHLAGIRMMCWNFRESFPRAMGFFHLPSICQHWISFCTLSLQYCVVIWPFFVVYFSFVLPSILFYHQQILSPPCSPSFQSTSCATYNTGFSTKLSTWPPSFETSFILTVLYSYLLVYLFQF